MSAAPGKRSQVKTTGGAIVFTDDACTMLVANTVFQITNAARQVWDRSVAIVVKLDTVVQAATLYKLNRLNGKITFLADIGGGHTITVSGSYLPTAVVIEGKAFSWEVSRSNLDISKFQDVWRGRIEGLKDGKCTIGKWKTVDETMSGYVTAGVPVVVEFDADTTQNGTYDIRMWALPTKDAINAVIANAVEESVEFEAAPDVDGNIVG